MICFLLFPISVLELPLLRILSTTMSILESARRYAQNFLQKVMSKNIPDPSYPYKEVQVRVISWEEDDGGITEKLALLSLIFSTYYGFHSTQIILPSTNPYIFLQRALSNLIAESARDGILLIIYYAGHGCMDENLDLHWQAYRSVIFTHDFIYPVETARADT